MEAGAVDAQQVQSRRQSEINGQQLALLLISERTEEGAPLHFFPTALGRLPSSLHLGVDDAQISDVFLTGAT